MQRPINVYYNCSIYANQNSLAWLVCLCNIIQKYWFICHCLQNILLDAPYLFIVETQMQWWVWWEDHAYVFVRHPASLSPQHETAVITALVMASPQTCIMDISNTATSNDLYQVNSDTKCYRGLCIFLSLVFNSSRKLMRFCVWL